MTEQDLARRVKRLAKQVGVPEPAIKLNDPPCPGPHVQVVPSKEAPAEIRFCPEAVELPTTVLDFLIAQQLIVATANFPQRVRRLSLLSIVLPFVIGVVIAQLAGGSPWYFIGVYLACYFLLRYVGHAILVRRLQKATDRRLVAVLGKQAVIEALSHFDSSTGLRWFLQGAPPTAPQRLRWL